MSNKKNRRNCCIDGKIKEYWYLYTNAAGCKHHKNTTGITLTD
jgi:hypothetical protein